MNQYFGPGLDAEVAYRQQQVRDAWDGGPTWSAVAHVAEAAAHVAARAGHALSNAVTHRSEPREQPARRRAA